VFEYCYCLVVDGGALLQGTADSAGYGSFRLEARTGQKQTIRLDFGRGVTNSEAEYRTLIAALKDLLGRIQRAGKAPSAYSLVVQTDAQLVVGQLTQGWQVKAANPSTSLRTGLRPLVDEAAGLLRVFGHTQLEKVPRAEIVRVLGH
jgi:ribonuclease HI